ncbi:MAG: tetratricopeptide (TPR) repeat protein [Bacteroidia bacterium]|jgi:tetratricopeptide (TPR) repeat protein
MSQEQEDNAPEVVATETSKGFSFDHFFTDNSKNLAYAGGALLLVAALVYAYFGYLKPKKEKEANVAIFMAERYYGMDSTQKALNGDGTNLGLIDVANEYSGTLAGKRANFYAGRTKMNEGQFEEAITYLKKAKFSDEMVGPLTLGLIGDCYSELENLDEAASYYMKAANAKENDFTTPYCLKKAATAYEKLGKWDKAYSAYKIIKEKYSKSRFGQEIDKYLARAEKASANS